jgi:hypothetical protein
MDHKLIIEFRESKDTLRIYRGTRLLFSSSRGMLFPLLEYIAIRQPDDEKVTVLDKVVGNAAALLAVLAGAGEVYSPTGSEIAVKTLHRYNIACYLDKVVPFILATDEKNMCPMEKLSLDKSPPEFLRILSEKQMPKT